MRTVLVIANETLGGKPLIEAVRRHAAEEESRFVLCVPQTQPRAGYVVYDDSVFDAAQTRVDLAVGFVRSEGIDAVGEVGDPDPYAATMDAVREYNPDAIIISTYPESRSGWLRRDLPERMRQATGLPVEHVVADIDSEGLAFQVTLAVANRTAVRRRPARGAQGQGRDRDRQARAAVHRARPPGGRRRRVRAARPHAARAGARPPARRGDDRGRDDRRPRPYTAITNALQYFRVDDIVISTLPETQVRLAARRSDRARAQRHRQGRPARRRRRPDAGAA